MFIRQWCALEHENNAAWMKPFDEVYPDPDEACPERTEVKAKGTQGRLRGSRDSCYARMVTALSFLSQFP
jgi:hypothetical protein